MKKIFLITVCVALTFSLFASDIDKLDNSYWRITISGNTDLLLKLEIRGNNFTFKSRKGSSKDLIGKKYFVARLAGKVKPTTVEVKGKFHIKNDSVILEGQYVSLTSKQDFKGRIYQDQLNAKLSNNEMTGYLIESGKPLAEYSSISVEALETTEKLLYNPHLIQSKEWKSFCNKINKLSEKVIDDYEFEKMYNIQVRNLPFSHYGISLKPIIQQTSNINDVSKKQNVKSKFEISRLNTKTILFSVKSFSATADEIIPFIDTLKAINPENLIIDLRNNGGGTIASALPLASYLINDTLYGGLFLTQKYFSSHKDLPTVSDFKKFPLFSEASYQLIIEGIHKQEGLCLMVSPSEFNYKGNVYILTNKNTASTCEPLVYGLKQNNRAVIVGERTAGAMLNGEKFELSGKFNLWLPTADYYTIDGNKIDKIGVEPNIAIKPELALEKVLEIVLNK